MNSWKKLRYRLEWLGCLLLARLIPMLPRRSCATLACFLGSIAYYLDARGRAVSLANIAAAFGERFNPAQRSAIARTSYQNFVRTMLDLFWARSLTPENHARYIAFEGLEVLRAIKERGESAVLMCIHHGNFEWASLACGFHGFPTSIVAENFKNPLLGPVFNDSREVSGHKIVAQESSMIRLLKLVKRGGFAGMLIDLNLRPTQAATIIDGFGMKMCVTFLHAILAQRGGAHLIPVEGCPERDGTCRVVVHPPIAIPPGASLRQITQACWDFFEPIVRENPERWMWAYKHWRYQPRNAARPYPFYANISSKFEKLLRAQTASAIGS